MSQLLNKSQINFAAAHELQKKSYYCSSVHCSYYSCIQLMMHIIYNKIGYDQKKLSDTFQNYRASNTNAKGGLHEFYINLVVAHLNTHRLDAKTFNKEIFKLKKTRTDADYFDIVIGPDECRFSLQKAEEINKIIQKAI